jgi:DNA replication licensing factor MCM2
MFLRNYVDENDQHVYEGRIQDMCQNNKQSIEVNFTHLSDKQPTLAIWLAEEPACMLPILNETAGEIVAEVYPDYHKIHS